jgi:hypothetical protein
MVLTTKSQLWPLVHQLPADPHGHAAVGVEHRSYGRTSALLRGGICQTS